MRVLFWFLILRCEDRLLLDRYQRMLCWNFRVCDSNNYLFSFLPQQSSRCNNWIPSFPKDFVRTYGYYSCLDWYSDYYCDVIVMLLMFCVIVVILLLSLSFLLSIFAIVTSNYFYHYYCCQFCSSPCFTSLSGEKADLGSFFLEQDCLLHTFNDCSYEFPIICVVTGDDRWY